MCYCSSNHWLHYLYPLFHQLLIFIFYIYNKQVSSKNVVYLRQHFKILILKEQYLYRYYHYFASVILRLLQVKRKLNLKRRVIISGLFLNQILK